jgi:phytoene synthase
MTAAETLSAPQAAAARAHTRSVAERSGSSFFWGMRVLPRSRREAMYAIYAFCREVDDIADEPGTIEDKLAALAGWRTEIDRLFEGDPTRPTTRALLPPLAAYNLPKAEFLAVIDGMEMDAREAMVAPSLADFELYCRRVAGAVGCLSICAFGATGPAAEQLAVTLGEALQERRASPRGIRARCWPTPDSAKFARSSSNGPGAASRTARTCAPPSSANG